MSEYVKIGWSNLGWLLRIIYMQIYFISFKFLIISILVTETSSYEIAFTLFFWNA